MFLWVYLLIALFGGSGSALDQAAEAPTLSEPATMNLSCCGPGAPPPVGHPDPAGIQAGSELVVGGGRLDKASGLRSGRTPLGPSLDRLPQFFRTSPFSELASVTTWFSYVR